MELSEWEDGSIDIAFIPSFAIMNVHLYGYDTAPSESLRPVGHGMKALEQSGAFSFLHLISRKNIVSRLRTSLLTIKQQTRNLS